MAHAVSLAPGASVRQVRAARVGARARARRKHPIVILQVFIVALMVLPSTAVLRPIGAVGYPAGLVGMLAFAIWAISTLLGQHDPQNRRHPVRKAFCWLWLVSLVSYVMIRPDITSKQALSADRWLMQIAAMTGIALITAECLDTKEELRQVLRALTWAAAFCGIVAGLQFYGNTDISHYLRLPGFTRQALAPTIIGTRGGLHRVVGTSSSPLELGVVGAMLLPLAIYMAIYDTKRSVRARWLPVIFIALAVAVSVSRSATIGLAITMSCLIVLMPVRQRMAAFAGVPIALAVVFLTSHGLIGTLASYFGASGHDTSISHRTDNYPYVEHLMRQALWFGHGGGTHIPDQENIFTAIHILDNQFLKTAIELGLVGVVALVALFLVPVSTALAARKRSEDPELRLLCAAVAGGALAAGVCSFFFDSFSFPMFYNVFALVAGLAGASWRLAQRESSAVRPAGSAILDRRAGVRPLTTQAEPFPGA